MNGEVVKPDIDWAGLSPYIALLAGSVVVLMLGLLRPRFIRESLVPLLAIASFGAAIGLGIWQWGERIDLIEGALRLDELSISLLWIFCAAGITTVLLSWRHVAPREAAHGEYYALLLTASAGMMVLAGAENLVTVFLGYELVTRKRPNERFEIAVHTVGILFLLGVLALVTLRDVVG